MNAPRPAGHASAAKTGDELARGFPAAVHRPETDEMSCRPPTTEGESQANGTAKTVSAEADGVLLAQLPAELASARQARSAIRTALAAWGMDRLSGDAELLASELVANAAEHGDGKPISLALHRHAAPDGQRGITCEITDTSPRLPTSRDLRPDAERGRGLAIVDALASASGVRAGPHGKTTWFTLALTDRVARLIEPEAEAGT